MLLITLIISFLIGSSYQIEFDVESGCDPSNRTICWRLDFSNETEVTFVASSEPEKFTELQCYQCILPGVPKDILTTFYNLEALGLVNVTIEQITDRDFEGGGNLKRLFLSLNRITELRYEVFKNVPNLEHLIINNNSIEVLDEKCFAGLTNLWSLLINANPIKILPENIFEDLTNVRIIDLSNTYLEVVKEGLFKNNRVLQELKLGSCKIFKVFRDAFMLLPTLSWVELTGNIIKEIELGSLEPLKVSHFAGKYGISLYQETGPLLSYESSLEKIVVKNSSIGTSPTNESDGLDLEFLKDARNLKSFAFRDRVFKLANNTNDIFSNLRLLRTLEITRANLKTIPSGLFNNLLNLEELSLAKNGLESLNVDDFRNLQSLKKLRLDSNELSDLDYQQMFAILPNLKIINLNYNRFKCTFLIEILEYMRIKGIRHDHIKKNPVPSKHFVVEGVSCLGD